MGEVEYAMLKQQRRIEFFFEEEGGVVRAGLRAAR
jgi:hypothetical protein